jgi:hypothetical protein
MRQYSMAVLTVSVLLVLGHWPLQAQTHSTGRSTTTSPKPSSDVYFINRAKNLARQAAIKENGGLERYRPNPVMYGPAVQTTYVNNNDGSITFTFTGGAPGATSPSIETVATVMPDGSVYLDYNGTVSGAATNRSVPSVATTSSPSVPGAANPSSVKPASVNIPVPSKTGLPNLSASPLNSTILPSNSATTPAPSTPSTGSSAGSSAGSNSGASFASTTADQDAFLSKARNLARQTAIKENGGLDRYRPEATMFGPSSKSPFTKNADGSLTFTFKGGSPGSTVMTVESVVTVSSAGSVSVQYNGPTR